MALHEIFDVQPLNVTPESDSTAPTALSTEVIAEPIADDIVEVDFAAARNTQYDLINKGQAALNTAMRIAAESEAPRAVETLALLLKTVSEMNRQLVTISKDREEVRTERSKTRGSVPTIGNQTNNVYVGSSTDLNSVLNRRIDELKVIDGSTE